MEENENVLDTEVEAAEDVDETFDEVDDTAEYDGNLEEENDATGEDADDEFEYDDEGNIVIPDVEEEEDDTSSGRDVDAPDGGTSGAPSPTKTEGEASSTAEGGPPSPRGRQETGEGLTPHPPQAVPLPHEGEGKTVPDPRDAEIEGLRKRLEKLEKQGKDTLKKLGKNSEDVIDGLVEVAAEIEGKSPTEYKEMREREERELAARQMVQNQLHEIKAASDLKELHAAFPETQKFNHVKELPDGVRQKFGRFRDMGLSAKEAYAAANPDGVRADVAASVKKQAQHDSKAHLKSSVPKGSKDNSITMSKGELLQARAMFPGKSDREIQALYKKVTQ